MYIIMVNNASVSALSNYASTTWCGKIEHQGAKEFKRALEFGMSSLYNRSQSEKGTAAPQGLFRIISQFEECRGS